MEVHENKTFDAYFKEKYPELYKDVFDENGDDRAIIGYSFAWSAWQAAKAQAVPEGFVLIGKECPDPIFADNLFADLKTRSFICDGEEFINLCDIDPIVVWKMMIEAQEQSHD
ncbi:hypothetical protein ACG9XR_15855 [Acinetobacter guillouiae]